MSEHNVTKLTPNRPDAEIAADMRARLQATMKPVEAILDEARALGIVVNLTISVNMCGKTETQIALMKPL